MAFADGMQVAFLCAAVVVAVTAVIVVGLLRSPAAQRIAVPDAAAPLE